MADEEIGQMVPFLEIHHQIQYLGLDRNIQGGNGFVNRMAKRDAAVKRSLGQQRPAD